jgi:hypothetical protein
MVNVLEDEGEDLTLRNAEMNIFVIAMRTLVNDTVHVQVQIVCENMKIRRQISEDKEKT